MKFSDAVDEDATWEQVRKPLVAVLTNMENDLRQIRKEIHEIKRRIEVLENRGAFVNGVWARFGDAAFKVIVSLFCGYLLFRFGLNN